MKKRHNSKNRHKKQRGYILLSIMLVMTLMLIALSIEYPRIAQQIRREKEIELIHRGDQYRLAIKRFFRKNGRYPLSIEQLENTNNVRFLRKRYKDPFTGKDDWRLLHVGEVQVNPLKGTNASQAQQNGQPVGNSSPFSSAGGSSFSNSGGSNSGFSNSGVSSSGPSTTSSGVSTSGPSTASTAPATGTPTAAGDASQSGSNNASQGNAGQGGTQGSGSSSLGSGFSLAGSGNQQFGGGPIIGVASTSKEKSIKEIDGKDHYKDWMFIYDPRLEVQQNTNQGGTPLGGQAPPSAGFGTFNNNGNPPPTTNPGTQPQGPPQQAPPP